MARGTRLLAGRALRGGRWSLVGLALVTALGGGAAIGGAVAAYRTDHAYGEYIEDAEVAELVVNTSVRTKAMDEAIRGFDGVESVRVNTLLLASVSVTEPTPLAEGADKDPWLQTLGSVDGRFIDVDRPAVHQGRVPSGTREVFVSEDYREELERIQGRALDVGDEIDVGFFWGGLFDADVDPNEVIEPVGVEALRISGFGVLADEVLPDELYPRQRLIISPDVTARYYCLPELTSDMSYDEAFAASLPEQCSAQYDYYSLNVRGGAAGVRSIRDQFEAAAARLDDDLPGEFADNGISYFYISQERADLDEAVRETTRPAVTALLAFTVVAVLATVTIAGLTVARQQRRAEAAHRHLHAIGATRVQLTAWSVTPLLLAAALGTMGALTIAFAVSPIGPLGTVRSVDPSPGPSLPMEAALPVAVAIALALAVVIVAVVGRSAWRAARPAIEPRAATGRIRIAVQRGGPSLSTGVGAAVDRRRAGAGVAATLGCAVATSVAAAAIVFGGSLSELVDEPDSYGWPWDITVITGGGYGDTQPEVVEERLARADVREDVVDHSYFEFDPGALLDGRAAPVVFGYPNAVDTSFPVLEGRDAGSAGEAVLGRDTASELDLEVGDTVTLAAVQHDEIEVEVVGLAALPELGSFVADRTGLDTGVFVLIDEDPAARGSVALTAIRLREGADPDVVKAKLDPDLPSWSALSEAPVSHAGPVRQAEIVNVSELQSAPLVLGGLLLASLVLGLGLAIGLSVRDRRRELAVLRALGFGDRDMRRSVRWHGLALVVAGLVIGVPVGVVAGRFAWRAFAERLGVIPEPAVPLALLVALVLVTLVLGWIAVALPARAAVRISPAEELLAT